MLPICCPSGRRCTRPQLDGGQSAWEDSSRAARPLGMSGRGRSFMAVLAVGVVALPLTASHGVASTRPAEGNGCSQLTKMASLFPAAKTVGFISRHAVKREAARQPIWKGWCGRRLTWTTYRGRTGSVDISVSLYATSHDVEAALAEPAYGPVSAQPNGSRVRANGPSAGSVNGAPSTSTGLVSAYRNLFISSTSISLTSAPVSIPAQLRLHRAIEKAFRTLR